ncbi:MAG: RNHCP domain-containing protein [Bacilli bacterium]|nr:RNHCP domain-containing protein [Bacilli bacterium]
MIDENFVCEHCHKEVSKLGYTARDHCPYCLYSKHVDINPGDRNNPCKGLLKPVYIEKYKDTFKIIYECEKCRKEHKNIMANDDNYDLIIELSQNEYKKKD